MARARSAMSDTAMSEKARGKQREIADVQQDNTAIDLDADSDDEPGLAASKSTQIPRHTTIFADDDYQRLLVENAQLRRQADLLAKRIMQPGLNTDETSQSISNITKTSQAEIQHLRTRLEHSESARLRLQTELATLRSFLLSTIAVQPTLRPARSLQAIARPAEEALPEAQQREEREKTPILLEDGTLVDQASSASRVPIMDNPAAVSQRATSVADQSRSQSPEVSLAMKAASADDAAPAAEPLGPADNSDIPQVPIPRRSRSRRTRVTMGDAETELLLCAAKRIQRVYRRLPGTRAPAVSAGSRPILPPLPVPAQSASVSPAIEQAAFRPRSATNPQRPPAAPPTITTVPSTRRRASKRHKSRSYKEADEDEEDEDDYNSDDAFSPGASENKNAVINNTNGAGNDDKPAKKKKKIGRPLGSPNKTKTISFNKIGNLIRHPPGLLFANQQLQLHQLPQQSMPNGAGQETGDGVQPEGSMEDLLAAAETMRDDVSVGGEPRTLRPRPAIHDRAPSTGAGEAEIDEDWPTTIQDEIDGSGDDYDGADGDGDYDDQREATTASSSRPSMRNKRNSRRSDSQSARLPPASTTTKSKAAQKSAEAPPQTPNGIERQISALDVLADQAASASTGPGGASKGQKGIGSNAAKSLQQALFSGGAGQQQQQQVLQNTRADANGGSPFTSVPAIASTQNGHISSLGDAFTYQPTTASGSSHFYQAPLQAVPASSSSTPYPSTFTSQYQPFVFPPLPQSSLQDLHSPNVSSNAPLPQFDAAALDASSATPSAAYASPYPPNHLQQFAPLPDYTSYETFAEPLPPPIQAQSTSQMTIAQQLSLPISQYHPLIDPEDLNKGMTPAAALAKKSRSPYIKWTVREDEMLVKAIVKHGTKWDYVAKEVPDRSYHQCRQRWLRGLKCGESLPKSIEHLRPQLEQSVKQFESNKANSKVKEAIDE